MTKPLVTVERARPNDRCNFCASETKRPSPVRVVQFVRETEDKPVFYEFRVCASHLDDLIIDLGDGALDALRRD